MSQFPINSVRAAVAKHGDDWMFADKRVGVQMFAGHLADCDVVSQCSYSKGGTFDPRVWSGVLPSEVPA